MKFSLSNLFLIITLSGVLIFAYISSYRANIAENRLYEVDLLLDRWIDARNIPHAERLEAIEQLLKTRKPAHWFWDRHSPNENRNM